MATRPNPVASRSRAPAARRSTGAPARRRWSVRGGGQSLAEFALTFPMLLLMVLFGLDFGRVFLGWVALNSAAREAANYAAMNPTAWTSPFDTDIQDEYERLIETEASGINCTLESPISGPTFPDGTSIGAPALVELECAFDLITPFIAMLIGDSIPVSASSAFPVRAGLIEDVAVETASPSPAPTATSTVAPTDTPGPTSSASPTGTPDPSATPTPIPTPTPSPTPATCTVISLLNAQTTKAQSNWNAAGFTGAVVFVPLVPPHYRIAWQSLTVGSSALCSSGITVRSGAP
jgi:hypothetical protein